MTVWPPATPASMLSSTIVSVAELDMLCWEAGLELAFPSLCDSIAFINIQFNIIILSALRK